MTELTETNRVIISEFARLFYTERDVASAFEKYVAVDYIQHNPGLADGRQAAVDFLTGLFGAPGARFEVVKIIVDGDLAAVHLRANPPGRPPLAIADFYRLEAGKVVEHWDVIQPVPEQANNAHPMF